MVHHPHIDQDQFAGCMEDDSTNMDASPTATEAAAEADAEADAEAEEISNRGYHSVPSISDHSHMLPYQQPLESVQLLTAQGEEDNETSSRDPFRGSSQLHAGAAPSHSVRLASAMSHLSQNQLQEGLQAVQVEPLFAGPYMHILMLLPQPQAASSNTGSASESDFSEALACVALQPGKACRVHSLLVDEPVRAS